MSKKSASRTRRFRALCPLSLLPEVLEPRQLLSMSVNAQGWTVVTPQTGDQIIYCSNSSGNDANNGLSATTPVKTLARAESLLQNNTGDELLLKAGDTWDGDFIFWKLSGRSATDPMVLGSYGTGARPIIMSGSEDGFETGAVSAPVVSNIAIMGISFICNSRDPAYTSAPAQSDPIGINILTKGSNILIENCEMQDYDDNINVQDFTGPISNVTIRRNVILDAWSTNAHAEGIYVDGVDGLTLYGNDFDHDGWNAQVPGALPTFFNQDAYLSGTTSNCVIEDNIFAEAAGYGLEDRPGGTVEGNIFINDPVGMTFGLTNGATSTAGGVTGSVTDNVFIGGANIGTLGEGNGLTIGNLKPNAGVVVSDNIFTQSIADAQPAILLAFGSGQSNPQQSVGINDLKIEDNVVYDWTCGIDAISGQTPGGVGLTAFNSVTIEDNQFEDLTGVSLENHQANYASQETTVGNEYFNTLGWMVNDAYVPSVGTTLSQPFPYAAPTQTVATYDKSLGDAGTLADFLTRAASQTPLNWQTALEATSLVSYFQKGFTLTTTASAPAPVAATSTFKALNFSQQLGDMKFDNFQGLGYIYGGDWAEYSNINFGAGVSTFTAQIAALAGQAGSIQLRLDSPTGTLIGTLKTTPTGAWSTYTTQSTAVSGATGVHNLYLVFVGGAGVCNISTFSFKAG